MSYYLDIHPTKNVLFIQEPISIKCPIFLGDPLSSRENGVWYRTGWNSRFLPNVLAHHRFSQGIHQFYKLLRKVGLKRKIILYLIKYTLQILLLSTPHRGGELQSFQSANDVTKIICGSRNTGPEASDLHLFYYQESRRTRVNSNSNRTGLSDAQQVLA